MVPNKQNHVDGPSPLNGTNWSVPFVPFTPFAPFALFVPSLLLFGMVCCPLYVNVRVTNLEFSQDDGQLVNTPHED